MPDSPQLVVFAHLPPPVHGQSLMVQLMLDGLPEHAPDLRIHHVDARLSTDIDNLGKGSLGKLWRCVKFAAEAIGKRLKHGAKTLYYIPAPAKKPTVFRDCLILALVRPFFPRIVLHWHAVGLGEWIEDKRVNGSFVERLLARAETFILRRHTCSMVLTEWDVPNPAAFQPRQTEVVPNGLIDPCPDFDTALLPQRIARQKELRQTTDTPREVTVGYIGHCAEDKGLFVLLDSIAVANATPSRKFTFRAVVAGKFMSDADRERFDARIADADLSLDGQPAVEYIGFVFDEAKAAFWKRLDLLAFPTTYVAESFGLVAVEAMAHGISPVTSDWRMLPSLMEKCGLPTTKSQDPESLANGLIDAVGRDEPATLRKTYLEHFSKEAHLARLAEVLKQHT